MKSTEAAHRAPAGSKRHAERAAVDHSVCPVNQLPSSLAKAGPARPLTRIAQRPAMRRAENSISAAVCCCLGKSVRKGPGEAFP